MTKPADRIPELIRDWADIARQTLAGAMPREDADRLGMLIARNICESYAGLQFYIPVGHAQRVTERDLDIYRAAGSGISPEALARKYGHSLQHIYRIIRRVRAVDIAARQTNLFPQD